MSSPPCSTHSSSKTVHPPDTIIVFFDGHCPLCSREMSLLRRKARAKGLTEQIKWVDIAEPNFDPKDYDTTKTYDDFMKTFHVYSGGKMHEAMDGVRAIYRFVGLEKWLTWTTLPIFRPLVDTAYHVFARFRPRLSRRSCKA